MPCDEVTIDASFSSDAAFDIELVSGFFGSKVGTRETLTHSEKGV
jgi:hypothetical protein